MVLGRAYARSGGDRILLTPPIGCGAGGLTVLWSISSRGQRRVTGGDGAGGQRDRS